MKIETTDITMAAYLKAQGAELSKISLQGTRGLFIFENVDKDIVTAFDTGHALIEPVLFHTMLKQLATACKRM